MFINSKETPITLEAFQSITSSRGLFETWADIIDKGKQELPINTEILGTVTKSFDEVATTNVQIDNSETKNIQYLREDLGKNNLLTLDKHIMFIYKSYMLPLEYSILDKKTAIEWSRLLSDTISQMQYSKNDYINALTIDTINKVSLALGNFQIYANADKDIYNPDGSLNKSCYMDLASKNVKFMNKIMRQRTKFSKGFAKAQAEWIISQDVSTNLQVSKTFGFSGSNDAYKDMTQAGQVSEILGVWYRSSLYLGDDLPMAEFKHGSTIVNPGSGTGNLIKPMIANSLFGIIWFRESLAFYGNNYEFVKVPAADSRLKKVLTWAWRMECAIKPVYARLNWIFLTKMPVEPQYTDFEGKVIPARDYSKFEDINKLIGELVLEQPQLYGALFPNGNTTYANQAAWDAVITANTIKWAGSNATITKKGLFGVKETN